MGYRIVIHHELTEFLKLEKEWETLLPQTDAWGAALTWTWMNVWLDHFGDTGELWLLTARDEETDDLVGIAPLFKRKVKPKYGFAYHQLEFIGGSHHHENLGFIIREEHKDKLIPEFIAYLLAFQDEWDAVLLSGLADEETCQILKASGLGWERNQDAEMISPSEPLPQSVDDWFSSLSRNRRSKLRGYYNKMDDEFPGEWQIKTITQRDELDEVYQNLVKYHQAQWEERGLEGAFFFGEWVGYFHDLMMVFLEKGWLRLNCLCIQEQPAAILFSYHYRGRAYNHISGINPNVTEIPLGHVMTRFSIETAISESLTEYMFMWGVEPYKYSFGAQDRTLFAFELISSPRVRLQQSLVEFLRKMKR